jgi:hypothetical protein
VLKERLPGKVHQAPCDKTSKQWSEHDSKKPKEQPVKMENSEDPDRKCWILRDKELHLNRGETNVNGPHAEGGIL